MQYKQSKTCGGSGVFYITKLNL